MDAKNTYWNNKGKYQKVYDKLQDKLVPDRDEADTLCGEVLRRASNLYYDKYNNGGGNFDIMEEDFEFLAERTGLFQKNRRYKINPKMGYSTFESMLNDIVVFCMEIEVLKG